jgi:hypothetical protein
VPDNEAVMSAWLRTKTIGGLRGESPVQPGRERPAGEFSWLIDTQQAASSTPRCW